MTAQANSMSPQHRETSTRWLSAGPIHGTLKEKWKRKGIMKQRKTETDWPYHRQGEMPRWVSSTLQKKTETGGGLTGEGQNQPKEKTWWTWASGGNRKVVTENCRELEGADQARKATRGFQPDGQNKGSLEPHSMELPAQRKGSGGDAPPQLRA